MSVLYLFGFWNKLPTDIKMAQSIDSFKFMLEGYKLGHLNGNVIISGSCLMKF